MNFIEHFVKQSTKYNTIVCGDNYLYRRTLQSTIFILCDGIGSGIYANIVSITCAERLMELISNGESVAYACETVAHSMHRARKEAFPFSAFIVAKVLNNGQFMVYTYESPAPVIIKDGYAQTLNMVINKNKAEVIGEAYGVLDAGDALLLFSDGITQAGLSHVYVKGIGSKGIANYINDRLPDVENLYELSSDIIELVTKLCKGINEDDSTLAMLICRHAQELVILTGPPSSISKDKEFVELFMNLHGKHVICGSTTADIAARELKKEIKYLPAYPSYNNPPEYLIEGIDLVTEGAIMLNQVYNILGEERQKLKTNSVAERLCLLLYEADVITFLAGKIVNTAHSSLLFKRLGVRPRHETIKLISKRLKEMGKLVIERYF